VKIQFTFAALLLACAHRLILPAQSSAADVTQLAAITVQTPDTIMILPLSAGQPRLYDSNPLRVVEKVRKDLLGARFISIHQRIINQYQIRVETGGILYAFGGKAKTQPSLEVFLGANDPRWVRDDGAVEGKNLVACFRRTVSAGEIITLQGFELQLAAKSIAPSQGALTAPSTLASTSADRTPAPSSRIEPLLEPCLDAILAPLERDPQMPRVAVEKLRASLGGGAVKAKTRSQKQIYQGGIAVCEALTTAMDERAQARATAMASAQVPSPSNGGSIVKTSPLRGSDAGANAEAIRKKQRDERNYADDKARAASSFMESSAYKAWVAKSATLRGNVMSLYGKLVQLEAAAPDSAAASK